MSETFRVGDWAVLVKDNNVDHSKGVGQVTASDLSSVEVLFSDETKIKVNAGNLRHEDHYLKLLSPEHHAHLVAEAKRDALSKLPIAVLKCHTCAWWRPPYAHGPGNCHNANLIALTRANDDGFPPPTPATFGCVHWESKEQPENGEDNDE
jgi:hypothetical protein